MSETRDSKADDGDEEALRRMVRGAMRDESPAPDVLSGFQRKVRERSRGKFYGDGWSTVRHPPINTYLITSLLMLAALFVIYALLTPLSGKPERVINEPAPVNVVAPKR